MASYILGGILKGSRINVLASENCRIEECLPGMTVYSYDHVAREVAYPTIQSVTPSYINYFFEVVTSHGFIKGGASQRLYSLSRKEYVLLKEVEKNEELLYFDKRVVCKVRKVLKWNISAPVYIVRVTGENAVFCKGMLTSY